MATKNSRSLSYSPDGRKTYLQNHLANRQSAHKNRQQPLSEEIVVLKARLSNPIFSDLNLRLNQIPTAENDPALDETIKELRVSEEANQLIRRLYSEIIQRNEQLRSLQEQMDLQDEEVSDKNTRSEFLEIELQKVSPAPPACCHPPAATEIESAIKLEIWRERC